MGSFSSAKGRGFYKNALLVSVALAIFPLSAEAVSDSRRIGPIVIYSSAALAPFVVGRGHYANVAESVLVIPYLIHPVFSLFKAAKMIATVI